MWTGIGKLTSAVLVAWAVAGCVAGGASSPASSPSPDQIGLGVVNGTDLQVTILVNGTALRTFAPHTFDKAILMSALLPLPWVVEALTSSGRLLVTMTADPGDVQGPAEIGQLHSAQYRQLDLSCGQLIMWTGADQPSGGGVPDSGSPSDCLP
jgi:hypothetical protein